MNVNANTRVSHVETCSVNNNYSYFYVQMDLEWVATILGPNEIQKHGILAIL